MEGAREGHPWEGPCHPAVSRGGVSSQAGHRGGHLLLSCMHKKGFIKGQYHGKCDRHLIYMHVC